VKKNLLNIGLDISSDAHSSQSQKACDPCATECEKISKKINNRKLSDIKGNEINEIISVFNIKFSF